MDAMTISRREIKFESRVKQIFTEELPHLAKAFKEPTAPPPPVKDLSKQDLGGKLGLPSFDNSK